METISSRLQSCLQLIVSTNQWGVHAIRIAIFIIFIWIGGLKFWNYEAEGIVPFVANSPFMNFFYEKKAPEYKDYKLKEGEFDAKKKAWHTENNTYTFSHGLGLLIMSFGILTLLGIDHRNTLLLNHNSRVLGARFREWRTRFSIAIWCRTFSD